jgi:CHAD domain-containing protein
MQSEVIKLKDIKPALAGYIAESQELLKRSPVPDDDAVHDIRVLMKKTRAVLLLVENQVTRDYCEKNIADAKEAGKLMAEWRESSVVRKTLRELRKDYPDLFKCLESNQILSGLIRKPEPLPEIPAEISERLARIEELLKNTGFRIRFEPMDKIDPQVLLHDLEKSFTDVCRAYLVARNKPTMRQLHEFRKVAKYLMYQLYFFRPLNPSLIKKIEKELEIMTQLLGKLNDLSHLIQDIGYKYKDQTNSPELNELVLIIREKQDKYLSKIWPVAYKLFCPGTQLVNILGFKLLVI